MFRHIILVILAVAQVLAKPVPLPFPLALMAPSYTNRILSHEQSLQPFNRSSSFSRLSENATSFHNLPASMDDYDTVYHYREQRALDNISKLYAHYSKARTHSGNLKRFAAQSASISSTDAVFQQNAVAELTAFDSSLLGIKTILDELGAEKGLMNYDRTNDLETLLKNVINFNKDTLSAVDALVYNIPILGPLLGPIVYEIKCLLDDVLNAVENIADALINGLQPLLQALIGQASTTACNSGVELLGLCI